jgi:hypothetical protein
MNDNKCLETPNILENIIGKESCRQRIGEWKSIRFGFGRKIPHSNKAPDPFYGEWEVGTYSSNWEIYSDNKLLFSSHQNRLSKIELDRQIQELCLGSIIKIELINDNSDVNIILDNHINICFYEMRNEEDTEVVHFFAPDNIYIEFHPKNGWVVEKSI